MDTACEILKDARRIAVLGMSPKPHRTSHAIALYMQRAGYEIVPVNPGHDEIEGLACYPRLEAIPDAIDIVDVFRAAEHEHEVCEQVLAMNPLPKAVWFQLNAGGFEVEGKLRDHGIEVFVDSCIKVVHSVCAGKG
ncbi:MAG: CoA-binding protein [Planctomycetes bacterium]|nr:CoA-binding protein [Planctomycetota bacterium]